ncbi:MAG: DUF1003 domain-containing protein [Rubrivivax sp.]|nr:MAG: DUF1003 domain-containing protein [Rubrivivax sp.]
MSTDRTTGAAARPTLDAAATAGPSSDYHQARTVEALTELNVRAILQLERTARANLPPAVRVANSVASFCGTIYFIWLHVAWFGSWIVFNTLPGLPHFDPFPFTFLTLVVSLEAIFLATFILISQNEENRVTERRNALDLQINLLTEQENTKMLRMLESIALKLGVDMGDDPTLSVLEESTRPEQLAEQIERASARVSRERHAEARAASDSILSTSGDPKA